MLKEISRLTMRALALWSDIQKVMPGQYREKPFLRDPVSQAWREASDKIGLGWNGLNELGMLLAVKAKIIVEKDQVLEFDGDSATFAEWCAEYDIPEAVVLDRVRCGWDLEKAIVTPASAEELRPAESLPEAEEEEGDEPPVLC
jgi:hypothetical protein